MDTIYNDKGCFYRALDDEPVFVLLARDPCTPEAIRHWVTLRHALIGRGEKPLDDHAMLDEALATAEGAVVWRSEATDPAKWGPGTKRWQIEEVPARVLIEVSELELLREVEAAAQIAEMPTSEAIAREDAETKRALLLSRIGVNLRRVTSDMEEWLGDKGTTERADQFRQFVTRIANIAAEAHQGVGRVSDESIDRVIPSHDKPTGGHKLPYDDWQRVLNSPTTLRLGNRFLVWHHREHGLVFNENENYAKSGYPDSWTGFYPLNKSLQRDMLELAYEDHVNTVIGKVDTLRRLMPTAEFSAELLTGVAARLRDLRVEYEGVVNSTTWPKTRKDQMLGFAARIERAAREIERSRSSMVAQDRVNPERDGLVYDPKLDSPAGILEAIADNLGMSYEDMARDYRRAHGQPETAPSDTVDVTDVPDLKPHRFAMFDKGRHWAYGRGLEISPSHIPAMLDRMQEDGWQLVSAIGSKATEVGMLFRREPQIKVSLKVPLPPEAKADRPWALAGTFEGFAVWVGNGVDTATLGKIRARLSENPCGAEGMGRGLEP